MIGAVLGWLAGSRRALAAAKWGAVGLTVLLFLLSVRRVGERAGRMAQRLDTLEKSNDVQRRMLEAAARRPRSRDELGLLPEGSALASLTMVLQQACSTVATDDDQRRVAHAGPVAVSRRQRRLIGL